METKKNKEKFVCEICDFSTSYKQNYLKHLSTEKHRRLSFGNKKELGEFVEVETPGGIKEYEITEIKLV